jgi:excinuclease ABC subunit A
VELLQLENIKRTWIFDKIDAFLSQEGFTLNTPIKDISEDTIHILLYGNEGLERSPKDKSIIFEGIIQFVSRHSEESSAAIQRWAQNFMNRVLCPECKGTRLKKEAHFFKIGKEHLGDLAQMDIRDLAIWFDGIEKKLNQQELFIGTEIIKEIRTRINFILEVGLEYLSLHRSAKTLSGGEAQRIRLATQIGSELMNVLYVLDEPSIGLHQRDNSRLISSLKRLRDTGNTVIVVEHDREMIESADFLVDIGPKAGVHGGEIINAAPFSEIKVNNSFTTKYLHGEMKIEIPSKRRKGNGKKLSLTWCERTQFTERRFTHSPWNIDLYHWCFWKWKIDLNSSYFVSNFERTYLQWC